MFIVIPLVLKKKEANQMSPYNRMNELRYIHSVELLHNKENKQNNITHNVEKSHK